MNQTGHIETARDFARRADEEARAGGNQMIAAELLWGAFAHCMIIVAMNDGLPHDSHGAFRRIAQHLDNALGTNEWRSRFGSAEQLHEHFYHGDLSDAEMRTHRRRTREGTLELLRVL